MRATCAWCGEIEVHATAVRCAIDPARNRALAEFACPACFRLILVAMSPSRAASRILGGASAISGSAPLELLEPHAGPPLTWDDLLDLHLEIERLDAQA